MYPVFWVTPDFLGFSVHDEKDPTLSIVKQVHQWFSEMTNPVYSPGCKGTHELYISSPPSVCTNTTSCGHSKNTEYWRRAYQNMEAKGVELPPHLVVKCGQVVAMS